MNPFLPVDVPTLNDILMGVRPATVAARQLDPGEFAHGWQYYASATREYHFRRTHIFPNVSEAQCALLRSQSGRNSARALTAVPSDSALTMVPSRFRVMLLRRLRLPFLVASARCEACGAKLDPLGDHYACYMRTGRVQARARPPERAWERILKEAGATTYFQKLIRETSLAEFLRRPLEDGRRIDILATGLPFYHGRPLLCDVTVRSPVRGNGRAHPAAASRNGVVLGRAEGQKSSKYKEAVDSGLCELLTLGCEVGGRWSDASLDLIEKLARHKVHSVPKPLKRSAELAWIDRRCAMVGIAVQDALAASLLAPAGRRLVLDQSAALAPELDALLDGQRWAFD